MRQNDPSREPLEKLLKATVRRHERENPKMDVDSNQQ